MKSLTELIEECGTTYKTRLRTTDDEHKLHRDTVMYFHLSQCWYDKEKADWVAGFYHTGVPQVSWIEGRAKTPEEAVQKLIDKLKK